MHWYTYTLNSCWDNHIFCNRYSTHEERERTEIVMIFKHMSDNRIFVINTARMKERERERERLKNHDNIKAHDE